MIISFPQNSNYIDTVLASEWVSVLAQFLPKQII